MKNLIIKIITQSVARAIAAQQRSLDSPDKIVLNRIALDHLSAEQGGACAASNNSCYAWINTLGKAEMQSYKNKTLGLKR